jgi:hypothetical protein
MAVYMDPFEYTFGRVRDYLGALQVWKPWGNTQYASMFGTSAVLQGSAPYDYTAWSAQVGPEPLPWERMRASADDLSPINTPGSEAAMPAFCKNLPPSLRYLFAPCVGAAVGTRAAEALAPDMSKWLWYAAGLALVVVGVSAAIK